MSASVPVAPEQVEFSVFSLDLRTGELRKHGTRLKLQERSFQVLAMLLERPGELVSRDQLRMRLWPKGTFVDFDHGINSTINRLRDTPGDSAATPRFIETVGRRGYRFVYPVTGHPSGDASGAELATPARFPSYPTHWQFLVGAGILLMVVVISATWWLLPPRIPRVMRSTRLSFAGKVAAPFPIFGEWFPAVVTDGSRIYFSTVRDATFRLAYLSAAGGDELVMTAPLDDAERRRTSEYIFRRCSAARLRITLRSSRQTLMGRTDGGRRATTAGKHRWTRRRLLVRWAALLVCAGT